MEFSELFCRPCITQMSGGDFWINTALFTAAALAGLWFARKNFHLSRLIDDMPTSRIRSASQGYVELVGIAHPSSAPAISPLSSTTCLWWRYTIERYQKTGKSSHWVTVEKGSSDTIFLVRDDTGDCQIFPKGADIHTSHRKMWRGHSRRPLSAPAGYSSSLSVGGLLGNYRYSEFFLLEGDPLYCLGHFISDATGQRTLSLDTLTGDILRHWKADYDQLLASYDRNGDGQLDMQEWQQVRRAAEQEARMQQAANGGGTLQHQLQKPDSRGLPFIIANEMQDKLTRKFRWKAVFSALLFLVSGSMTTWLLTARTL